MDVACCGSVHRLIIFWTVLTAAELPSPVVFCSRAEQVPKQDLLTLTRGSMSFSWLIQSEWLCVCYALLLLCVNALVCYWITWSIAVWLIHQQHNSQCIISLSNGTEIFHGSVSLCAVSRLHQTTVANSVEIKYNVVSGCRRNAIYCCSTLFKWPAFSEGRKQQSVFHCMESRLQPPATTWQLKTAHYKKTENPCLMFLLSEGGTAISSYPSQAFPL